jgi:hypothetical protein
VSKPNVPARYRIDVNIPIEAPRNCRGQQRQFRSRRVCAVIFISLSPWLSRRLAVIALMLFVFGQHYWYITIKYVRIKAHPHSCLGLLRCLSCVTLSAVVFAYAPTHGAYTIKTLNANDNVTPPQPDRTQTRRWSYKSQTTHGDNNVLKS